MKICTCSDMVRDVCKKAHTESDWAGGPVHPDWLICGHAGEQLPGVAS